MGQGCSRLGVWYPGACRAPTDGAKQEGGSDDEARVAVERDGGGAAGVARRVREDDGRASQARPAADRGGEAEARPATADAHADAEACTAGRRRGAADAAAPAKSRHRQTETALTETRLEARPLGLARRQVRLGVRRLGPAAEARPNLGPRPLEEDAARPRPRPRPLAIGGPACGAHARSVPEGIRLPDGGSLIPSHAPFSGSSRLNVPTTLRARRR